MAFKRIKDWATSISAFRSGDVIPVDGPSGTAKMAKDDLLARTAENALGSIHSLNDTATDFASDDYVVVDGTTNGSRKMSKNTMLQLTAINALVGSYAAEFDPTRDAEHQYLEGEPVVYQGNVYIFRRNHYGAWDSGHVMAFKFERFLKQYFYRNRVSCWTGGSGTDGGKEISDYLSRLVLDLKIDITDSTDFSTFWNGPYNSPNGTPIEKRFCGISWTRNNAVQFWMMRDLYGEYMSSSFGNCALFRATEADSSAVTLYDRVKLHTRTTTWGGVAIKATFVIDWSVFENKTSNLSYNLFANEIISVDHPGLIQVYKFIPTLPADLNTYSSRILRLEENVDCNPIIVINKNEPKNYAVQKAVVDARFTVPDEDYDNFWNTGVTVNDTYYPEKNFTYAYGGAVDTVVVAIYWATPNGNYISGSPGNLVAQFGIDNAIHLKDTLYLASKTVTVAGVSLKIEVVIDTKYILPLSGTWSGNLFRKELVKIDHAGHIFENKVKETAAPSVLPDFSTLTMGVGGDSITAGNQWSYYASQVLAVAHHQNEAVGSSYYACRQVTYDGNTYTTQNYDDPNFAGIASGTIPVDSPEAAQKTANNCARCHLQKFIAKVTAGDYTAPDIFCLAYGTNDSVPTSAQVDASIASATNLTINESLNMAGGLRWVLQTITETYPNCKIFVLLPIQGASASRNTNNLSKIEAIKKVCQVFSVPVIDMFSECGIAGLLETGTGPYLSDGLHPNDAGRKLMGSFAAERIIALYGRHLS